MLCSISSRDFFHENRGHMWSNRHNFQPEAPHLVCTITSYNVCRSIIIHRSLCHGRLHNAVFCAIRHIEYRSHVLHQRVSWRLCSAARPFGQDREFPRHPNILLSRIGEELSWVPHLIGHSDTVFTPCQKKFLRNSNFSFASCRLFHTALILVPSASAICSMVISLKTFISKRLLCTSDMLAKARSNSS